MPTALELKTVMVAHEHTLATLATRFDRPHVALTCSGSAALEVALTALELAPGDEVVLPAVGCHRIAASVLRVGAVPVFTPVGRRLVLTPDGVNLAMTPATRAVIAVHQYGLRCPVDAIRAGLPSHVQVIEDAAQSSGLPPTVASGPLARPVVITSFGPTKPIPLGFGGAIFADDPAALRLVGTGTRDEALQDRPALPVPFPERLRPHLAAALLSSDQALRGRRHCLSFLGGILDGAGFVPVFPPTEMPSWTHLPVWCRSAVLRDVLLRVADECGLPAQSPHHVPLAELPLFRAGCRAIGPVQESSQLAIFRATHDADLVARFAQMLPTALEAA
jgi:dTDP-4-amino-4,6-dideoxygalactose transaminase